MKQFVESVSMMLTRTAINNIHHDGKANAFLLYTDNKNGE